MFLSLVTYKPTTTGVALPLTFLANLTILPHINIQFMRHFFPLTDEKQEANSTSKGWRNCKEGAAINISLQPWWMEYWIIVFDCSVVLKSQMFSLAPDGSIYRLTQINLPLTWGMLRLRNTFFWEIIFSGPFVIDAFLPFHLIGYILK